MSNLKEIVEYLQTKNIVFKSLKQILPKELGSRKKIAIYVGVDLKGYYADIMVLEKKSRVLRKEVGDLLVLHEKLEKYIDSKITKKYIFIKAPLCSHAKKMLEENGWKVMSV
ncbi:hypothetical protein [Sulfurovum sp.]|uniref:hypothetical protein n=1 Tax=Sulfurovum sp. TaxID=1969726 RepID=UPI0025E132DC|nr:hypothetical protein [Sulfurovum sp.]